MRKVLTVFLLISCLSVQATHWLTYYVYFETDYVQGPWTRTDILEESGYTYLAAKEFRDLFGSVQSEMVGTMLSRLKDEKPKIYNWTYDVTIEEDEVIITPKGQIKDIETVKNEVTATITMNNFNAVTFRLPGGDETWTIDDLTLPYMDLVSTNPTEPQLVTKEMSTSEDSSGIHMEQDIQPNKTQPTETGPDETSLDEVPTEDDNAMTLWLIISGVLNVALIGMLIKKKR